MKLHLLFLAVFVLFSVPSRAAQSIVPSLEKDCAFGPFQRNRMGGELKTFWTRTQDTETHDLAAERRYLGLLDDQAKVCIESARKEVYLPHCDFDRLSVIDVVKLEPLVLLSLVGGAAEKSQVIYKQEIARQVQDCFTPGRLKSVDENQFQILFSVIQSLGAYGFHTTEGSYSCRDCGFKIISFGNVNLRCYDGDVQIVN